MGTPFSLANKIIIITGASSGIGRTCAVVCCKMGATVVLVGRNQAELEKTFALLDGANHLLYAADITNYTLIESLINEVVLKLGRISGFIHAAGIQLTLPLKNTKVSDYEKIFSINVFAGFEFVRLLSLKKNCGNGASFILMSSVLGSLGKVGAVAYCASKSALLSGAKALALELANKSIRVNCVSPGVVMTDMVEALFESVSEESQNEIIASHPLGLGQPADVANACVYLLSDAARWVTGSNLIVDGGYTAK